MRLVFICLLFCACGGKSEKDIQLEREMRQLQQQSDKVMQDIKKQEDSLANERKLDRANRHL